MTEPIKLPDRDEIIRMAIQCQLITTANRDGVYMDALERFASLVAGSEREACAQICDEREFPNLYGKRECAAAIRARK